MNLLGSKKVSPLSKGKSRYTSVSLGEYISGCLIAPIYKKNSEAINLHGNNEVDVKCTK
jgi:hypothetical protein